MPATIGYIWLHLNVYNENMARKGGVHQISDYLTSLHLVPMISSYSDTIREVADILETNISKICLKNNIYPIQSGLKKNWLFSPTTGIVSKKYFSLQFFSMHRLDITSVIYFFPLNWHLMPLCHDIKHSHVISRAQP